MTPLVFLVPVQTSLTQYYEVCQSTRSYHFTCGESCFFYFFLFFSVSLEKLVRQSRPSPWRAAVVLKYAAVRDDSSYLCIFSLLLLRFFCFFFLHPWHFTCRCCQLPLSQKSASESHRQEKCSLPLHGHRRSSAARNQKQQLLAQNTPVWSSLCRFIENPTNCQTGFNVKHRVAFSLYPPCFFLGLWLIVF